MINHKRIRFFNTFGNIKELRNYYIIEFIVIFGLNLNCSIFFLYPMSLGLSFTEMTFVYFSVTRIIYFLTLVPTGILADRYNVKYCLISVYFLYAVAYIFRGTLPFMILPLTAFIISETLMGLADSTMTGASEKYLYSFKNELHDGKMFSMLYTMKFWTRAVSTLIGGAVVFYLSMKWTQLIGGIIIFIGFLLSMNMIKQPKYAHESESILHIFKKGLTFSINHKKTFFFIIGNSLLALGILASRNAFQPLLEDFGLDITKSSILFSLIFTIQMVFSGIGSFFSGKIEQRFKISSLIYIILIAFSLLLLFTSFTTSLLLLIFFIWILALMEGSYSSLGTIQINRFIEKENIRATVTSLSSLVSSVIVALFIPIIGKITDNHGIAANLRISSILVIIGAFALSFPHFQKESSFAETANG